MTAHTSNGQFRTTIPEKDEVRWVIAHYLGGFGAATSESDRVDF